MRRTRCAHRHLLSGCRLGSALLPSETYAETRTVSASAASQISIIAHRGSDTAKPNTLAAFLSAADEGADAFECDLRLTRDRVPVVVHTQFGEHAITLAGRMVDLRATCWQDIQALESGQPAADRTPRLEQVIDVVRQRGMRCYLEPKEDSAELVGRIFGAIESLAPEDRDRIALTTFSTRRALLARIGAERARSSWAAYQNVIVLWPFQDPVRVADRFHADAIAFGWDMLDLVRAVGRIGLDIRHQITRAHDHGIQVTAGVARTAEDVRWLIDLGIDQIFTARVALAREIVGGAPRQQPWPPKRGTHDR